MRTKTHTTQCRGDCQQLSAAEFWLYTFKRVELMRNSVLMLESIAVLHASTNSIWSSGCIGGHTMQSSYLTCHPNTMLPVNKTEG